METSASASRPLTHKRFYQRVNRFLDHRSLVLADTGDYICAAAQLYLPEDSKYICQGYYMSIGYTLPAALGVKLATPEYPDLQRKFIGMRIRFTGINPFPKKEICMPYRILSPGKLGYTCEAASFQEAMKTKIDLIAANVSSIDPGPYYLRAGKSYAEKAILERDFT